MKKIFIISEAREGDIEGTNKLQSIIKEKEILAKSSNLIVAKIPNFDLFVVCDEAPIGVGVGRGGRAACALLPLPFR